jgi:ubiquinone/menaquinone biosynthesis C-methylase UbiE
MLDHKSTDNNEMEQRETFRCLEQYYSNYDEEGRLLSKHGQVEYRTTMTYIHKFLRRGMRILEVGAGTGRYTIALAHEGYQVDAVELLRHNLDILKSKLTASDKITARQGNALDLSVYADETFDLVLVLGPMYHLYNVIDKRTVLKEAIRVAKKGGR